MTTAPRTATFERKSRETEIHTEVNLDGQGACRIKIASPIGLLNHMLELFAFHGLFDLKLNVIKADTEIDIHHTNEDIGIVLGKTFRKALGEMTGIRRFGLGAAPMESTLGTTVVDVSGRGYLSLDIQRNDAPPPQEGYSYSDLEHFLESFAHNLGASVNVRIDNPSQNADLHTVMETVFKSLGLALKQAVERDPRRGDEVPSTKGIID